MTNSAMSGPDYVDTNPLLRPGHRLKLGIFGTNASYAGAMSSVEGTFQPTWGNAVDIATVADLAGMEAIVPVARWRGFGGRLDFNASVYEPFTWAAGISGATRQAAVFSTCHVPTLHPVVAAKQGTTVDHISGGRFALNVVAGWFPPEMEMFGRPVMEHELRYDYTEEWLEVVKRLWAGENDFDHVGRFFKVKKGFHQPKPIQQPFPPIMQAGGSPRGRDFAAKHADIVFVTLAMGLEAGQRDIEAIRTLAREKYGRELQVWTICYGGIEDTDAEAERFVKRYVEEEGDWEGVTNMLTQMGLNAQTFKGDQFEYVKYSFVAGWGGHPLVGAPDTIARKMEDLPEVGVDGTLLLFARYQQELERFAREVMPLLPARGLRASPAPSPPTEEVGV